MGRKKVAADCLTHLLQRPGVSVVAVLTDSHLDVSATAEVAAAAGLPLLTFDDALARMRAGELSFDLGLSMLYWRRLREEFLTSPRFGIINFHPAPLPEYKGVGGYNLAILEGLSEWAATAHYVDASIDTGPIVTERRFPIDPERETAQSLERASQEALGTLFAETLDLVLSDPANVPTRPNGPGRYLSRPELEAMKRLDLEMDDVPRKVRAFWFPPYDGAHIEIDGVRYTLVERNILESLADANASSLFSPSRR